MSSKFKKEAGYATGFFCKNINCPELVFFGKNSEVQSLINSTKLNQSLN